MKSLKSMDILGIKYSIKHKKIAAMGECDKAHKSIVIDSETKPKDYVDTLIHEGLHGLFCESGVDQTMSIEQEEMLCVLIPRFLLDNFNIKPKKKPSK